MRTPAAPPDPEVVLTDRAAELYQLLARREYQEFVRRSDNPYWHWDKARFTATAAGLDPELAWALIKLSRRHQYRELPLRGHLVQLRYKVTDHMQRELMLIDQQLAGRISFDDDRPLPASQREQFILSTLREEAIASSMLEGAATTRLVAKEMLRSGRAPRSNGERMVANNYRAMEFIKENRDTPLTPAFLIEVQRILTHGTLADDGQVGRLRTDADDVVVEDVYGQLLHKPPPADELTHRLRTLCKVANETPTPRDFLHPVLRACTLHFQLGFDHPFCDGNGRTARAIFYWHMLRSGYWLFEYLPISRLIYESPSQYGRAYLYVETDEYDVTYFLNYHLRVIARVRQHLREYLARKQNEIAEAKELFKTDLGLNPRQRDVMLSLTRNPEGLITINLHQTKHGVAYGTARADLLELADRGYLTKSRTGKRFEFTAGPRLKKDDATLWQHPAAN